MGVNVRESILEIGSPAPLIGILTEAENSRRRDTALILLNSGIMHRVGSCRLSVRIARSVAVEAGLPCVRFDFSGLGDSASRRTGGVAFDQAALREVVEVMDHLKQTRGINKFILYGLCSGARIACSAAELDDRIVALVQVDGVCYPTMRSHASYYISRLCSWAGWRARAARWLKLGESTENTSGLVLTGEKKHFEVPEFAGDPSRDKVAEQLRVLMEKDIRLHCVFTGRGPAYRYRSQYNDCFSDVDFGNNLSVDYYPNASHIFTEPLYQQQMVTGILAWLNSINSGQAVESHTDLTETELEKVLAQR